MTASDFPITYQYLVVSADGTRTLEQGGPHCIELPEGAPESAVVLICNAENAIVSIWV